jgi:hypothetical protein
MVRSLRSQSHIVVIDARPKDYRDLGLLAGEYGWHVHFLTGGRAAIQFARPSSADLWMINVRLPEMLRPYGNRATGSGCPKFRSPISTTRGGRRACRNGAALYLCKDSNRSIDCKPLLELLITDTRVDRLPDPVVPQSDPVVSQADA